MTVYYPPVDNLGRTLYSLIDKATSPPFSSGQSAAAGCAPSLQFSVFSRLPVRTVDQERLLDERGHLLVSETCRRGACRREIQRPSAHLQEASKIFYRISDPP